MHNYKGIKLIPLISLLLMAGYVQGNNITSRVCGRVKIFVSSVSVCVSMCACMSVQAVTFEVAEVETFKYQSHCD